MLSSQKMQDQNGTELLQVHYCLILVGTRNGFDKLHLQSVPHSLTKKSYRLSVMCVLFILVKLETLQNTAENLIKLHVIYSKSGTQSWRSF